MKDHLGKGCLIASLVAMTLSLGCDSGASSEDAGPDVQDQKDGNAGHADADADTDSDTDADGDADADAGQDAASDSGGPDLCRDTSNPYEIGPFDVRPVEVAEGQQGAPVAMVIHVPTADCTYPIVVFQHGFLMANAYYSTMLRRLASHGFVVVAPQMYAADNNPIGKPKSTEEAALAARVVNWLPAHLDALAGAKTDPTRVGFAGHSRGGKVIWTELLVNPTLAIAVAGVDPVDGEGGPLGGEARIADEPFNLAMPSLAIGTGLGPDPVMGQACAPAGDNHVQFYMASSSPAYHSLAVNYGHLDMLNDDTPGCLTCTMCPSGPARDPMRVFCSGQLAAFFRGALQNEPSGYDWLTDAGVSPIIVQMESK